MKKLMRKSGKFISGGFRGLCLSVLLVLFSITMLYAQDPLQGIPLPVRDKIIKTLPQYGNPKVEKVTDIGGLYEVIIVHKPLADQILEKRGIFYVSKDGSLLILGPVIGDNYNTYTVLRNLDRIDVNKISTEPAVKIVRGDGSKKLFVFTDPDCPFCKKLQNYLKNKNNYTAYVYFFPLEDIHPGVTSKVIKSLCAKDVNKSVEKLLFEHEEDLESNVCEGGKDRLEQMMKTALKLGMEGTPMVITGEGRYIRGADIASIELYFKTKETSEKKESERVSVEPKQQKKQRKNN